MMDTAIAVYIALFSITFLISPLILAALLKKIDKQEKYSSVELLIISCGGTPALIALLLNYLLFLLPGFQPEFYAAVILSLILMGGILQVKECKHLLSQGFINLAKKVNTRTQEGVFNLLFLAGIVIVFIFGQLLTFNRPLIEHDILEYATQAKIFFRDRFVEYSAMRYDEISGFFYVGLHGFLFIMLSVWEQFFNSIFNVESDFLFRNVTVMYGLLILITVYYWLRKIDYRLALITSVLLMLNSGVLTTFLVYHVDMFRIFLLMSALILMLRSVNTGDNLSFILFGVFAGLSANAHSIGVFATAAFLIITFFFMEGKLRRRVQMVLIVSLLSIAFGGVHYLADTFYGTGWIFKDIKFY